MSSTIHLQLDSCPACGRRLSGRRSTPAAAEVHDPERDQRVSLRFRVCQACLPGVRAGPGDEAVTRLQYALECARHRVEHLEEQESSES